MGDVFEFPSVPSSLPSSLPLGLQRQSRYWQHSHTSLQAVLYLPHGSHSQFLDSCFISETQLLFNKVRGYKVFVAVEKGLP